MGRGWLDARPGALAVAAPPHDNRGMRPEAETIRFAAELLSGPTTAGRLIDWAVEQLMNGDADPAVLELASLDARDTRFEDAFPILSRALSNHGVHLDAPEAVFRSYFQVLLQEIVSGKVSPAEGVDRIYHEIIVVGLYQARFPGFRDWYDASLQEWDLLHGRIRLGPDWEIPENEFPGIVRRTAERVLASTATSPE